MAKPVLLATLILAALFGSTCRRANADFMEHEVHSPKHCGPYLEIKSTQTQDGLVAFVVRIQAEKATNAGELYKGRVGTTGYLKISSADATLGAMSIQHSSADGNVEFEFKLAPQLAKHSIFTLQCNLYEKDGFATLGGGERFVIHLEGFLPGKEPN